MPMTIANVDMARAWDGEEGDQWTDDADRYDASGQRIWRRFLDAGLISPPDRVLDVGCGAGQSTLDVARLASAGSVLGVDLSARMLELAHQRAQARGVTNVELLQADAQVHRFEPAAFDVAISRFGAMFFNDRAAAFANIAATVRPGGRLALLGWRALEQNQWLLDIRDALAAGRPLGAPPHGGPGPFGLADAEGVTAALAGAGFDDVAFTEIDEAMYLGADADDAWAFVSRMGIVKGLTASLDEAARVESLAKLRSLVDAHETADGVLMDTAAWLITARRA
jgi:SAM-dependent methyltransferase